jgi:membrane-associated phospholipid phosphatase
VKYYIKEDRPKLFFEKLKQPLHEIQGVSMHSINSFPSGHTASAFALFLCLCFITQRDWLKFLFFIMAFVTGFSRIYLSQHFALDVLVGSLIGIVVTYTYAVFHQKIKVSWFDKSLISLVCNKN